MTTNITTPSFWHEKISDSIKSRKCAFLIGGGISHNSGIPSSVEIMEYCLQLLHKQNNKPSIFERFYSKSKKNNSGFNLFLDSQMPFEYFMDTLALISDITPFFEIYRKGEPNSSHEFIAELALSDKLPLLVSTNFDLCIEKAFQKNRLACNVKYDENDFNENNNFTTIFKLHGDVNKPDSILKTLSDVASKKIDESRKKTIQYLLEEGNHNLILVMGYSCSDTFDISPIIENSEPSNKTIIFIEHVKNHKIIEIEHISIKKSNNPFLKFNGIRIYVDTDMFILQLWDILKQKSIIQQDYHFQTSDFNWRNAIDKWYNQNTSMLNALLGILYYRIGEYEKAAFYLDTAVAEENIDSIHNLFYSTLGNVYLMQNKYTEAEDCFIKCLKRSTGLNDKEKTDCLIGLGSIKEYQKQFSEAITLFEKAKALSIHHEWEDLKAKSLMGIGNSQNSSGQFDEALANHFEAHKLCGKLGDRLELGKCYTNIGNVFLQQKKYSEAIESFHQALELIEATKNLNEVGRIYLCIGIAYRNYDLYLDEIGVYDFDNSRLISAANYFDKAALLFHASNQFGLLQETYDFLSIVYKELGKEKKARTYAQRKQQIETTSSANITN